MTKATPAAPWPGRSTNPPKRGAKRAGVGLTPKDATPRPTTRSKTFGRIFDQLQHAPATPHGWENGGLTQLREELEAENSGVCVPAEIRRLGGAKVQARYQEVQGGTSSVVAAVLGEAIFGRLCKSGARLFGRWHEVDAYEGAPEHEAPVAQEGGKRARGRLR